MALLASAASRVVLAADAPRLYGAPQLPASAPVVGAGSLLQVMVSLLLVLAAVFAAAWLMRRLRGIPRRGQQPINIIADVALGAKERAVLLQIGKDQILVGVAPGQVNTLYVLSQPLEADPAATRMSSSSESASGVVQPQGAGQGPNFKSLLRQSLGLK